MKKIIPILFLALASGALAEGHPEVAAISTSGTTARSALLGPGYKLIYCSAATHFATGNSAVTATTADLTLPAATAVALFIDKTEPYIAFILDSSTGTCSIYARKGPPGLPPPPFAASVNGAAIAPGSVTATGDVTASRFISTFASADCAYYMTTGAQVCSGVPGNVQSQFEFDFDLFAWEFFSDVFVSGNYTGSGSYATNLTTAPQFKCTGAGACQLQSATSQHVSMDTGGGTSTAAVGDGYATTTTIGRSGNIATNLNGTVVAGASTTAGTITLSGGTGTAAVRSGARCVCSETTSAATPGKCAVSSTTLTATYGVGTDVITYICL